MIWLLIGYMWLELHRPFEVWPVLATYHVERVYVIASVAFWLISRPSLPRANRLHWCFALFVLVMLTSWYLSPYKSVGDDTVQNYLKYCVFYILLVTSVRTEDDLRKIVAGYLAVMTLWMAHSIREFHNGRTGWAQGILRLYPVCDSYDFNDFAGLIVCSLPFAWVLWRRWTGWRRALVGGYFGLSAYCIVMTGSRMGFVGLLLAGILACLSSPKRWRLLVLYPVLLAAAWCVLPNSQKERYGTLLGEGHETKFTSAGDYRAEGFEVAWPLFQERPLLGFGPSSFGVTTGKNMMPHNLYGQLLAELGIAGAVAFGLIIFAVARNALEARGIRPAASGPEKMLPWHTMAAASATVVLLLIMSWGFNFLFWHVWLWYGGFQVVALQLLKSQAAEAQEEEALEIEESRQEAPVET